MVDDPWLTQRMADYAQIRRAEAILYPAVREAVAAYLQAVTSAVLGHTTASAYVRFQNDDPPDLSAFPDDSVWQRLVQGRIAPAIRTIFTRAWQRITGSEDRAAPQADDHTEGLAERLAGFPRAVWDRLRALVTTGQSRGETPAQLRARVEELMTLDEWNGQALTMTRTATMTALNAGALAGAVDEQQRTGQTWTKRWQATLDARVRDTHRDADAQLRGLYEPFTVGGHALQFPGDPTGPPEEVINCRCSARYAPTGDPSLTATPGRTP